MISKRTAIILIIAIAVILSIESFLGMDKMNNMEDDLDHTVAQVTLMVDGEFVNLEGTEVKYDYDGAEETLTAKLSTVNETGYENLQNNSAAFKPCGKGNNTLTFTIPKDQISGYDSDLTVNFGYENNEWDFNNYSLVINLTTVDEASVKADITQTVYYPDESGNALNEKAETSTVVNSENSIVDCILK